MEITVRSILVAMESLVAPAAPGTGARTLFVSFFVPMPTATATSAALVTFFVTSVFLSPMRMRAGGRNRSGSGTRASSWSTLLLPTWLISGLAGGENQPLRLPISPLLMQCLHLQLDQLMHLLLQRQFAFTIATLLLVLPLGGSHQLCEVGILLEAYGLAWRVSYYMLVEQQLLGCTVSCL